MLVDNIAADLAILVVITAGKGFPHNNIRRHPRALCLTSSHRQLSHHGSPAGKLYSNLLLLLLLPLPPQQLLSQCPSKHQRVIYRLITCLHGNKHQDRLSSNQLLYSSQYSLNMWNSLNHNQQKLEISSAIYLPHQALHRVQV